METQCPVCRGKFGLCRGFSTSRDTSGFHCDGCGRFEITRTALCTYFADGRHSLSEVKRSALSHNIRIYSETGSAPLLGSDYIEKFLPQAKLPSGLAQASNIIRMIGDYISKNGHGYPIDSVVDAPLVGSFDAKEFDYILQYLLEDGIVRTLDTIERPNPRGDGVMRSRAYGLTLGGWEKYEEASQGRFSGSYGFIALRFGEAELDDLLETHIRPGLKDRLGFDLVDMRTVSQAGIIDNIMRAQIRDAAFVIADLTHDNYGAYWEAGYAEGLSKPVIYICEATKFREVGTHFDTNHSTTLMWSSEQPADFIEVLIATIRRSLNLFSEPTA